MWCGTQTERGSNLNVSLLITHPTQERLATPLQWGEFFYVPQEPDERKSCETGPTGFSSLSEKTRNRVRTALLSSSNSMTFHELLKFSVTSGLAVTFLVSRYFLTLNRSTNTNSDVCQNSCRLRCSTNTNSDVRQNSCRLRCLITPLYLTLSLLRKLH